MCSRGAFNSPERLVCPYSSPAMDVNSYFLKSCGGQKETSMGTLWICDLPSVAEVKGLSQEL